MAVPNPRERSGAADGLLAGGGRVAAAVRRRQQLLHSGLLRLRHLAARGAAVVCQQPRDCTQRRWNGLHIPYQRPTIPSVRAHSSAQQQLAAAGIHHCPRVVRPNVLVLFALAHQPEVHIRQVELPPSVRLFLRRLNAPAVAAPRARPIQSLTLRQLLRLRRVLTVVLLRRGYNAAISPHNLCARPWSMLFRLFALVGASCCPHSLSQGPTANSLNTLEIRRICSLA